MDSRSTSRRSKALALGVLTGLCLAPYITTGAIAEETETKAYGDGMTDRALLYAIRAKGARGGNSVVQDLFAGTTLLMSLRGNSYGFAYVDPGRHRIWGTGDVEEIDFVPGETYFLLCGDQGMALLDEEEGLAHIDSVLYYMRPDSEFESSRPKKEAKAAKMMPKIDKQLARYVERIELAETPAPPRPVSTDGLVRVPAYSRVEVELMENVSSFLNELGDSVWFRVRQDAIVAGQAWLRAGTPLVGTIVEIKPARKGGVSGDIEIEIPFVDAADGTRIPLIGQFVDTGRHRKGAAARLMVAGGLLGGAFSPRGREAFELRGDHWHVWARSEAWVAPADPWAVAEQEDTRIVAVRGRFVEPLIFNLEKHKQIPDIALEVESETALEAVALTGVGDWSIPAPPKARRLSRSAGRWTAVFDGWSLLRHLVSGAEEAPLRFTARTADGRSVTAIAEVSWEAASPE